MKLSVVTTMYNSARYLEEFHARITGSVKKITDDYEIIFVNDGSPDDSLDVARRLLETDEAVRVVDLSRNFGHHKAIMTGLAQATGDQVFLIDCDLEEKPELLEEFHQELTGAPDTDVIYGMQDKRKGTLSERLFGSLFYSIINLLSDFAVPRNVCTVRLMTGRYVRELLRHTDRELFFIGVLVLTGFKQKGVTIDKLDTSATTYTLGRKLSNLVNAVTSFTVKPLVVVFYAGFFILCLALGYSGWLAVKKLVWDIPVPGYTSLLVSIWFLGGLMIASVGVVGIYLSKVFLETKRWPYTVIRQIYQRKKS